MKRSLGFLVLNFIKKTKCLLNLPPRARIEFSGIPTEREKKIGQK